MNRFLFLLAWMLGTGAFPLLPSDAMNITFLPVVLGKCEARVPGQHFPLMIVPCKADSVGNILEKVDPGMSNLFPRLAVKALVNEARQEKFVPHYGLAAPTFGDLSLDLNQNTSTLNSKANSHDQQEKRDAFSPGQCCAVGESSMLRYGKSMQSGEPLAFPNTIVSPNGFYSFTLQNNGQLVIYDTLSGQQTAKPIWWTGAWTEGPFSLLYQSDGNLVEYFNQQALWTSAGSKGAPGGCLAMQNDRNLVLYDGNCQATWSSGTISIGDNGGVQWWVDNEEIIGSGDGNYQCSDFQHGPITSISVWTGDWTLRGIQVTHFDGFQENYGTTCGSSCDRSIQGPYTLNLAVGETVTHLSLYGNGAGSRNGGIHIKTSGGQDFFPHMYGWGLKTEYPQPVGSGIIGGVQGYFGSDIVAFGFIMVRPYSAATMQSLSYGTPDNPLVAGTSLSGGHTLQATQTCRKSPQQATCTIGNTVSATNSFTFTNTDSISIGIKFTIKNSSIPFVEGPPQEISIQYQHTWQSSTTQGTSITTRADYSVLCPANTDCTLQCTMTELVQSFPYKATGFLSLDNGNYYAFSIHGRFDGNLVSQPTCTNF